MRIPITKPNCTECAVEIGQAHDADCGRVSCITTGDYCCEFLSWSETVQVLKDAGRTDLAKNLAEYHDGDINHDCGAGTVIYEGYWPRSKEAAELNLWTYFGPEVDGRQGWVQCTADHPNAVEDLNTMCQAPYDPKTRTWSFNGLTSSPLQIKVDA
jgi:hypothetical protein